MKNIHEDLLLLQLEGVEKKWCGLATTVEYCINNKEGVQYGIVNWETFIYSKWARRIMQSVVLFFLFGFS